jgi:tRNA (guanine-N7-)-methyltransferase
MGADKGKSGVRRPVRSYVLRQGRLTPAQQRALKTLWPRYGLEPGEGYVDFSELFGRTAPVVVEIGFGNGEALAESAAAEPGSDFVGIEVHQPGVGHLLRLLQARDIGNVRIVASDAVEWLQDQVPDASLAAVRIWFPDPWPKKRHHKRRLIQPGFVGLLARKMEKGGVLHLATDWVPYAEHMLEVLSGAPGFRNLSPVGDYCERPSWRPLTRFEKRGQKLGHETRDLLFQRQGQAPGVEPEPGE